MPHYIHTHRCRDIAHGRHLFEGSNDTTFIWYFLITIQHFACASAIIAASAILFGCAARRCIPSSTTTTTLFSYSFGSSMCTRRILRLLQKKKKKSILLLHGPREEGRVGLSRRRVRGVSNSRRRTRCIIIPSWLFRPLCLCFWCCAFCQC